jgi:hypothetical protein
VQLYAPYVSIIEDKNEVVYYVVPPDLIHNLDNCFGARVQLIDGKVARVHVVVEL